VVRSHCVEAFNISYPQGGSGAIFSLAASRKLVRDHRLMLSFKNQNEDVALGQYLKAKGINVTLSADPHFSGHGWNSLERLRSSLANMKAVCPLLIDWKSDRHYGSVIGPLREIVFYHAQCWNPENGEAFEIAKQVFSLFPSMWWYTPVVCYITCRDDSGRLSCKLIEIDY
jgi:hypothetical protein